MKRLLIISAFLLFGTLHLSAQGTDPLESFRSKILPQFSGYFEKATLSGNDVLSLSATARYTAMTSADKRRVIESVFTSWSDSLLMVQYGTRRELWGRSKENGNTLILDQINMTPPPVIIPENYSIDTRKHPWFLYFGGQFILDNSKNITLALNTRVGVYLLKDRWDFATTFSGGVTGNADASGTGFANIGLMSRVHFPIRKIRLSPSVGGEVTYSVFGNTDATINYSLFLGLSWYIGIGSLDIGVNIGNTVYGSGGYTISPRPKSK